MRQRVEWIDACKGFTMLLVILGHCLDGYLKAKLFVSDFWWMQMLFDFIYSFHMPLFFVLSGYLFYYSYNECPFKKIKYKILDLALLYFGYSVVQVLVQILLASQVNRNISVKDIFLLPVYTIPPYWYLYVLMFLYLISSAFFKPMKVKYLVVSVVIAGISLLLPYAREFSVSRVAYYLPFFIFGGFSCIFRLEYKAHRWHLIPLLAFSLILYSGDLTNKFYDVFIALALSLIVLECFWNFHSFSKVWLFNLCGKYCLPIYLIHCYLTAGTRIILHYFHVNNSAIYISIGMILGIFVPILVYKICLQKEFLFFIFKPIQELKNIRKCWI